MDMPQFKQAILRGVFGGADAPTYELTAADWAQIEKIRAERYDNWEWNVGRSPKFTVQKSERFPVGKIDVRLDVEKGRIQALKIYGDFSGRRDVAELEAHLAGVRYERPSLAAALQEVNLADYFGDLLQDDFLGVLY